MAAFRPPLCSLFLCAIDTADCGSTIWALALGHRLAVFGNGVLRINHGLLCLTFYAISLCHCETSLIKSEAILRNPPVPNYTREITNTIILVLCYLHRVNADKL